MRSMPTLDPIRPLPADDNALRAALADCELAPLQPRRVLGAHEAGRRKRLLPHLTPCNVASPNHACPGFGDATSLGSGVVGSGADGAGVCGAGVATVAHGRGGDVRLGLLVEHAF